MTVGASGVDALDPKKAESATEDYAGPERRACYCCAFSR